MAFKIDFRAYCLACILVALTEVDCLSHVSRPKRPTISPTMSMLGGRQSSICTNHAVGEFVVNPTNCNLFYLCMDRGEAVVAACPPTMLFNPQSKLCDMPSNVRCEAGTGSGTTASSQLPQPATTVPPPPSPGGSLAEAARYCASLPQQQELSRITYIGSASSCQQYYICYYGQALLQECSANLHWNANTGKCDLPRLAGCILPTAGTVTAGDPNNNPSTLPPGGANTGVGGEFINCPAYGQHIYPHMDRCDFFIYCVKGHAILQQCPFYYHFDIASKRCKWRTAALCVRNLNLAFVKAAR